MRTMRVLVVEQEFGERAREFGLADAGWAEKDERADRPLGIAESGARTANGIGDSLQRRILADDALAQAFFHGDQLFDFAFEHLRDRNAGPLGDDARDVFFVDFFFEHALAALVFHLLAEFCEFLFSLRNESIANLGDALVCCLCAARIALRP